MKMKNNKKPIIAYGEYYTESIKKNNNGFPKNPPNDYDDTKEYIAYCLDLLERDANDNQEYFMEDKILCVRMEKEYEAKSYQPNSIVSNSNLEFIGGRRYTGLDSQDKRKLYFLRGTNRDLAALKETIVSGGKDNIKTWKRQLCTINTIDYLSPEEKIMGFDEKWDEGNVEIILHPIPNKENEEVDKLVDIAHLNKENVCIRTYENGPIFICAYLNKEQIVECSRFNPLRSIKPLPNIDEQVFRSSVQENAPKLPKDINKGSVNVGVFDGGVNENHELLKHYSENIDITSIEATTKSLSHGTAVCGAVLYGAGNQLTRDVVENPDVFVKSFRILPSEDTGDKLKDFQMYSAIDKIEDVVKNFKDTRIYNVSFGPHIEMLDDDLSRFTYTLDRLTYDVEEGEVNPLFCVAAGNENCRVMVPSDIVNGLCVGSYSLNYFNEKYRADYSCYGPGREGGKIKPDVLDFGGSRERQVVVVSATEGKTTTEIGTSIASPIVAGKIGSLMSASELISPHLGRTLIIHTADVDENDVTGTGFGYVKENIEDILCCEDNKVTVLYEGELTSKMSIKLPIFTPGIIDKGYRTKINWTICTIVNPNSKDTDSYTSNCIEDTFYPNDMVFNFTKKGQKGSTIKLNLLNPNDVETASKLLSMGYGRAEFPVSYPAKKSIKENDLRNHEYKWDTVVKKGVSMNAKSLVNPFLTLHAIGRDGHENDKIKFFVAVTIDMPKYDGSLYDTILEKYNLLSPIKVRNTNRVKWDSM